MPVAKNDARQATIDASKDEFYNPNEGGLYELTQQQYQQPKFPTQYQGMAVKALRGAIIRCYPQPAGIKLIFMRRDPKKYGNRAARSGLTSQPHRSG